MLNCTSPEPCDFLTLIVILLIERKMTSRCVFSRVPSAILNELLQRENRVLHFWTLKKRRLDQCQQYVVFERSAKQVGVSEVRRENIWF